MACCIALRQHYAVVWEQSNSSACHVFFEDLNIRSSGHNGKHANQNTLQTFLKTKTQDVAAQKTARPTAQTSANKI